MFILSSTFSYSDKEISLPELNVLSNPNNNSVTCLRVPLLETKCVFDWNLRQTNGNNESGLTGKEEIQRNFIRCIEHSDVPRPSNHLQHNSASAHTNTPHFFILTSCNCVLWVGSLHHLIFCFPSLWPWEMWMKSNLRLIVMICSLVPLLFSSHCHGVVLRLTRQLWQDINMPMTQIRKQVPPL